MSFQRKRRISVGLSSAYFLASTLIIGYVVGYHAIISCCGIVLLVLTAPLILYGVLAHFGFRDFRRMPTFVDPQDYGMSIGTANFIFTIGLLLPLPLIVYGVFFASGLSFFALDGSPASVCRTYSIVAFDEKIFGHRMAQREFRRAARIYTWKHNYKLGEQFMAEAISCAEEHTPDKLSRIADLHYGLGKIASQGEDWCLAEKEFSTALQMRKKLHGEDCRCVKGLTERLKELRDKHPCQHVLGAFHKTIQNPRNSLSEVLKDSPV